MRTIQWKAQVLMVAPALVSAKIAIVTFAASQEFVSSSECPHSAVRSCCAAGPCAFAAQHFPFDCRRPFICATAQSKFNDVAN